MNQEISREIVPDLHTNHRETDIRICLHGQNVDEMPNVQNIVVRASDTVIAVILIHHTAGFK